MHWYLAHCTLPSASKFITALNGIEYYCIHSTKQCGYILSLLLASTTMPFSTQFSCTHLPIYHRHILSSLLQFHPEFHHCKFENKSHIAQYWFCIYYYHLYDLSLMYLWIHIFRLPGTWLIHCSSTAPTCRRIDSYVSIFLSAIPLWLAGCFECFTHCCLLFLSFFSLCCLHFLSLSQNFPLLFLFFQCLLTLHFQLFFSAFSSDTNCELVNTQNSDTLGEALLLPLGVGAYRELVKRGIRNNRIRGITE